MSFSSDFVCLPDEGEGPMTNDQWPMANDHDAAMRRQGIHAGASS
jgi:hypothetical protein